MFKLNRNERQIISYLLRFTCFFSPRSFRSFRVPLVFTSILSFLFLEQPFTDLFLKIPSNHTYLDFLFGLLFSLNIQLGKSYRLYSVIP